MQGSGFIAYGTIMAILLLAGGAWVRRSGRSPDWWDSWVIMLWVSAPPASPSRRLVDATAVEAARCSSFYLCDALSCARRALVCVIPSYAISVFERDD